MGKKSKKIRGGGLVYSTNPDTMGDLFSGILNPQEASDKKAPLKSDQVRVWLDRKGRNGKEVSLIKGISGNLHEIKKLASFLKTKCGVGGAVKNGEIMIQGNHRDKIVQLLLEKGYKNTKKAGG